MMMSARIGKKTGARNRRSLKRNAEEEDRQDGQQLHARIQPIRRGVTLPGDAEGLRRPERSTPVLLWVSGAGPGHHWDVTTPINKGMRRFMHTLRLATAATAVARMVWLGEPGRRRG